MFSTHAYFENADFAGADAYLNAVADQTVYNTGDLIRIPPDRTALVGSWVGTPAATRNYARFETPSIRTQNNEYSSFFDTTIGPMVENLINWRPRDPRILAGQEQAQFLVNTDDAGAQDHMAVIWLADGPLPVVGGKIFTVRATAAIAQAAGVWRGGVLTFQEQLPYGDYDVVGLRVQAASGTVGRLIFDNMQARPGAPLATAITGQSLLYFRYGLMGIWGTFNSNTPPQLEMLGGTATAQIVYLDLIRRA